MVTSRSLEVSPVVLTGQVVRLEPMSLAHAVDLAEAGADESIWKYMRYGSLRGIEEMNAWIQDLLARQAKGTDLPFTVIHLQSGRAIGATRYLEIYPEHLGLEIGGTWYAVAYQRTAVNTECKYLLLKHAFEVLGCIRVQFKTDLRNEPSQRAVERLGAIREGVLRDHIINPDGFIRSSVYFSILAHEWPAVKKGLEEKLTAYC